MAATARPATIQAKINEETFQMKQKQARDRALMRSASRATPDGYLPGSTISRSGTIGPASYNAEAHTVEAVFSTGAEVQRFGMIETLLVTPEAVDLSRVTLGQVRLLDTHDQYSIDSVFGVVISARIASGNLIGVIRFADTDAGRKAEGMVARGEVSGISIGYRVSAWSIQSVEENTEIWRADKWELMEVSLVSVPADPYAGIRSASAVSTGAPALTLENDEMKRNAPGATVPATTEPGAPPAATETRAAPAPAAPVVTETRAAPAPAAPAAPVDATVAAVEAVRSERGRIADINTIGRVASLDATLVTSAIDRGISVEAFRAEAFNVLATRSAAPRIDSTVHVITDEQVTRRDLMSEALQARFAMRSGVRNVTLSDGARQYAEMGLPELAAECIGHRGHLRTARVVQDVVERAFHTTSDFPAIFQDAINRRLLGRYQVKAASYRLFSAPYINTDFRPSNVIRAGDFPQLQPVSESGEIKQGTFSESKEILRVYPYGVGFNISRHMIINDNLHAIDQVLGSAGDRVVDFENSTMFALLATNPTLVTDGVALFHASHGNVANTGAINVANVGVGRAAMMKQQSLDGMMLNLAPAVILCGPDKQTEAEQLVTSITPAQNSNAVPEAFKKLVPVADANVSGNTWYLFADPAVAPAFLYGSLEGFEGPRLTTETKFGTQGLGVQLEHDFGVAGVDYRGAFKNG
jgi:HK97 family phage prohead protease